MRILHAPTNTANQPGYIVKALRRLGHEAELWEYGTNPYGFPVDRRISLDSRDPRVFWDTFREAMDRFEILHFHFGRSLFPSQWRGLPAFWDLPIYRALGKRVFFTFHGSDCRIRRIHEEVNPWSYYRFSDVAADDDRTAKRIEIIRTYAHQMFVVSPDYLPFVPEATVLPRVIDLDEWPSQPVEQREAPTILHVPSRRGTKGTTFILEGIAELERAGLDFTFKLLEGVSHAEAREAIRDADIVIDNVITGDYELVSIEGMASSRVAVANIQENSQETFPNAPVYSVEPSTFVPRMRALIEDLDLRRRLAVAGRPYVAEVHDSLPIASRLVEHYQHAASHPPGRSFPGWASMDDARSIERLEQRMATYERALARSRTESAILRRRLGLAPDVPVGDGSLKDLLPSPVRLALRRARARIASRGAGRST